MTGPAIAPPPRKGSLTEGAIHGPCQREGCGDPWYGHRGPNDAKFGGKRECVRADCLCPDYIE
jgi:hypothetical protein